MRGLLILAGFGLVLSGFALVASGLRRRADAVAMRGRASTGGLFVVLGALSLFLSSRVEESRGLQLAAVFLFLFLVMAGGLITYRLGMRKARNAENRGLLVSGLLFVLLAVFGTAAGVTYYTWAGDHPELAGVGLLLTFFAAASYLGFLLIRFSAAAPEYREEPDTGLHGAAHPERGAADEHGNIHTMGPTLGPFIYSVGAIVLFAGLVYRQKLLGPWGIALGLVGVVAASTIWFRNVSHDTALANAHGGHEEFGGGLGGAVATVVPEVPSGPPGPANYFEQLRQAVEAGDSGWAADAYASDAVYYEPANPPHLGREAIRAYLNDFMKGHGEARWTIQRMGVDGAVAVVEWNLSFRTRASKLVTDQPGVTVIEAGPDGITYHRDYV
jgi:hypothetical protein